MHTPKFSPVDTPSRLLQIHNNGDEVRRHDLTLYFMKFQTELEAFNYDMDKTSNEAEEMEVVRKHWNRIFKGE